MKITWPQLMALVVILSSANLSQATELDLMPWPAQIERQVGFLNLDQSLRFAVTNGDSRVKSGLAHFKEQLNIRTGMSFHREDGDGPLFIIRCAGQGPKVQRLREDESYQLTVDSSKVELTASDPLGILHGLETLLQLVQTGPQGWVIPAVQVDDRPRFPWRGLMIDVSRHFMPIEVIERNITGMAAVKLNVLHLHLSDDEGFRVESLRNPRLTQLASGGLFYKQTQMRDLLRYARDRGIRVVPEFDVPGHAVSWLVAYPELASAPGPITLVRSHFDKTRPPLDPTQEATYRLLNTVFTEMAALFPDAYFHIGGDEVDGKYWDKNQRIQAWMQAHSIKDNHALQAYFNQRIQVIVKKQKKHMEGWDEILSPNLPKDTLIQSWRGAASLADAAKMGYPTLLSAGFYLDLMYPASMHYAVEPLSGGSASLTLEQQN